MLQGSASHMCEAAKGEDGSAFRIRLSQAGVVEGEWGGVVEDQGQTSLWESRPSVARASHFTRKDRNLNLYEI